MLEDTLIGRMLTPSCQIGSRKVVSKAKFYFFDTGVVHQLQQIRTLSEFSSGYGDAFESFIFHELISFLDYNNCPDSLHFWRTVSGVEVDFVLKGRIAIEAKATKLVDTKDLKGLKSIAQEEKMERLIVVSRDPERRRIGDIEIWPVHEFLRELWAGNIVSL